MAINSGASILLLLLLVATSRARGSSGWRDVERNEPIMGHFEGKPFQVKTESVITASNMVSIGFLDESGETFGLIATEANRIQAGWKCYGEATVSHNGINGGGIWTFLKSSTNMTVWFNDTLVTEYVYNNDCSLKDTAYGIEFRDTASWTDNASVAYRGHVRDPPTPPNSNYSDWRDVERSEPIMGDFEEKPFQVTTEAAITDDNQVSIEFVSESGEAFGFIATETNRIQAGWGCYNEAAVSHGGINGGGIWTFLKGSTNMTVWFNDTLVTQYVYSEECSLKEKAYGIQFRSADTWSDTASAVYRAIRAPDTEKCWTSTKKTLLKGTKLAVVYNLENAETVCGVLSGCTGISCHKKAKKGCRIYSGKTKSKKSKKWTSYNFGSCK